MPIWTHLGPKSDISAQTGISIFQRKPSDFLFKSIFQHTEVKFGRPELCRLSYRQLKNRKLILVAVMLID